MNISTRATVLIVTALSTMALLASPALADDVFVSAISGSDATGDGSLTDPYASLQAGVDAAAPGDTVWAGTGLYSETVSMAEGVTLVGAGGAACTINGPSVSSKVRFDTLGYAAIEGFTITGGGHGIACVDSAVVITGCTITGNAGLVYGAGIHSNGCTVTVRDCTIWGNTADSIGYTGRGAGLYSIDSTLTIEGTAITSNNSLDSGGALYASGGSLTSRDSSFSQNDSREEGAGLYLDDVQATLTDCVVADNATDREGGGGIRAVGGSLRMQGCLLRENDADGHGGAVLAENVALLVVDCTFYDNSAGAGDGGAMDLIGPSLTATVTGSHFADNYSSSTGGAIDGNSGVLTIQDSTFTGNRADSSPGGALYLGSSCSATVARSVFDGNSGEEGGAIATRYNDALVTDCLILDNESYYAPGGGVNTHGGQPTIENCTIAYNEATNGGGISSRTSSPTITNCIVWGNSARLDDPGANNDLYGCSATYSDISDGDAGTGNLSADPSFADISTGDYRLKADSPCIDFGAPTVTSASDCDGTTRPLDGDAVPGAVQDMGAYEYDGTTPVTTCDPDDALWRSVPVTVTLTAVDPGGVQSTLYRLSGGAWTSYEEPFVVSDEGTTTIDYYSYDWAGHVEATKTATVRIDTLGPIVAHDAADDWQSGPVTVTLSSGPGTTIAYRVDGGPEVSGATPVAVPVAGDGVHTLWYQAVDSQDTSGPAGTATVRLDGTDPVTLSDIDGLWQNGPVTVTLAASDSHSGVAAKYYDLGSGPVTYTAPFDISAQGETSVDYWSVDTAGNADSNTGTVRIDDGDPEVSLDPTTTVFLDVADFSIVASDAVSGIASVHYSVDGGTTQDGTSPSVIGSGDHTLECWAFDAAGNESSHTVRAFSIVPSTTAVESLEGPDRYHTACQISQAGFPHGSDSVVIATGQMWPDALAGSALAGVLDAPILLVRQDSLPAAAASEIERLSPSNVYIMGGTSAVSEAVEGQLRAMVGTAGSLERIWGADRYKTAEAVALKVIEILGGSYDGGAFVATAMDYPDAIAAAPVAVANGWPIFLAGPNGITAHTLSAMSDSGVADAAILGGTSVLPSIVETQLAGEGIAGLRLAGVDRYATAAAVAEHAVASCGMTWNGLGIGTGEAFADALTGGVLQGQQGSVMLLTPGDSLHASTAAALAAHRDYIASIRYLGGTGAVGQSVRDQVKQILR